MMIYITNGCPALLIAIPINFKSYIANKNNNDKIGIYYFVKIVIWKKNGLYLLKFFKFHIVFINLEMLSFSIEFFIFIRYFSNCFLIDEKEIVIYYRFL